MGGMIPSMRLASTFCAALLLAGCLHAPVPHVVATAGAGAPAPATFRVAGRPEAPDSLGEAVSAALATQGWRPAAAGAPAEYLVVASYGDRPARVGAFVPGPDGGDPQWMAERIPPRPWNVFKRGRRALSLVVLDAATGRELRRTTATLDYWRGSDPEALRRLAGSAAASLSAPD
ncbi:hypothetical protein ACO2Q0_11160 [Phenylobacterium sp. VNQ135]|uniref:hypothetical protein n=1 Tax=Phenylobacterium sp. VNQ135 TaxID=3400922 RepID=UPI003C0C5C66